MSKLLVASVGLGSVMIFSAGCASNGRTATDPRQPGPAVGQAVGTAVGAVTGNVAGAAVGAVEGTAGAFKKPFTNETRVVRTWRTEKTSDGRTIQVPVDTVVDKDGRPVEK